MANFNRNPYYDDFSTDKDFYRILYRPGFAVQARELTQSQSILQNQIAKFGEHVFKEGSVVIPGAASLDTNYHYVKVADTFNSVNITSSYLDSLLGKFVVGSISGVRAQVVNYALRDGIEPITLFVKYVSSGNNAETKTFLNTQSESLVPEGIVGRTVSTVNTGSNSNFVGLGSAATITRGVFYIQGFFASVKEQTIILDRYSNTPSYSIGLELTDDFVTPEEDPSLLDNAEGSFNFSAPGAHRYKLVLTLTKRALATATQGDVNYIQLIRVENGKIQQKVDQTEYNELEKTLARRTFDESGNYVVRNFDIDIREYRNNDRGNWVQGTYLLQGDVVFAGSSYYTAITPGTTTSTSPAVATFDAFGRSTGTGVIFEKSKNPFFNQGVYRVNPSESETVQKENEAKLAIGLEPGKAYVNGFELKKDGTEYLTVKKSREFTQATTKTVLANVGNYVFVTNVNYAPSINYATVNLYNGITNTRGSASGTLIGTARVTFFEYDSGAIGTASAVYKLGLTDIKFNGGFSFNRDVKQFHIAGGSSQSTFTADVHNFDALNERRRARGFVTIPTATAGQTVTVTGNSTVFTLDFKVGDYFADVNGNYYRVASIISNSSLTATALNAVAATLTNIVVYRLETAVFEPNNNTLLFSLPNYAIRTTRDALNINRTTYFISQQFQAPITNGVITLTVPNPANQIFGNPSENDYYVITNQGTGEILTYGANFTYASPFTTVSFNVGAGVNGTAFVIATLKVVGAEKIKTLDRTSFQTTNQTQIRSSNIRLNKADGFRLISVLMSTDTVNFVNPAANTFTIDVTNNYSFSDGQTENYYDLSSINLLPNAARPTGALRVTFEYFNHSAGDYFSVDSYSSVRPEYIPTFNNVFLRDMLDFRPRIADDGLSFVGTGSSISGVPKRGEDVLIDYSFYYARKDKIFIDQVGKFVVKSGESDLIPQEPSDVIDALHLYTLSYEPYTIAGKLSVNVASIDNRRYTMRDIGKLERRVDTLEYYTSLSLLEQDTNSLQIIDPLTNLNRFKNGFFVDNFSTTESGFPRNPDQKISIDISRNICRPTFSIKNVKLIESVSSDTQRTSAGYKVSGEILTLPFTETTMVEQLAASRIENINPFAIFTFLGTASLLPETDEWFETRRAPDIIQNVEGNFNALNVALTASGALGTVWDSWRTNWSGVINSTTQTFVSGDAWGVQGALRAGATVLSRASIDSMFGFVRGGGGGVARATTAQIDTIQSNQSRNGIRTSIVEKIDRQIIDDRVINTEVIPFIRSRNVLFFCRGLKPLTKFYGFFDGTDVKNFITPATRISIQNVGTAVKFSGKFDTTTNAGAKANERERRVVGTTNTDSAFSVGDVVYVSNRGGVTFFNGDAGTTPAWGVVVHQDNQTDKTVLHLVNVFGTFVAGDILTGSISGVQAKFANTEFVGTKGGQLTTNFAGDVVGVFNIPNTNAVRFRTGSREFKLTDSPVNDNTFTSNVRKTYSARGILETKQQTIRSTRNAEVVQNQVNENRTIFTTNQRVISDTGWYDPIAQTFLVQSDGGAFITSVDIWFATKSQTIPVQLEIREVINGYPGKLILPFSKVILSANEVNLANTQVVLQQPEFGGRSFATPTVATRFTFKSPVYLQNATEYCIVLSSDSNDYNVWISELGERAIGTNRIISEQPYAGVFFKSQNASTWTANQNQDLMFRINKAVFNTNVVGEVNFINDVLPYEILGENPIYSKSGSSFVRITFPEHHLFPGSKIELKDVSPANGFSSAQLNKVHTVTSIENDSLVIDIGVNATFTGNFGGSNVSATGNVAYSTINFNTQENVFTGTSINYSIKTTAGSSTSTAGSVGYTPTTTFETILANDNVEFFDPKIVASKDNQIADNKTLVIKGILQTTNPNVSPVIDLDRLSVTCIHNKQNKPSKTLNISGLDTQAVLTNNTNLAVANSRYETANAATRSSILTMEVGKYITISGFADAGNNGEKLITRIADDGSFFETLPAPTNAVAAGSSITINIADRFVDEIAPFGGSTYSKYLTNKIKFANTCTSLDIRFAADVQQNANVEVYYRTSGDARNIFDNLPYIKMQPKTPIVKNNDGIFYDVEYYLENLPAFDAAQIKIVFTSDDDAEVSKIRDLRVIGLA